MKNNYYALKNKNNTTKRRKHAKSSSGSFSRSTSVHRSTAKHQSNIRKRKAKKLNYKKVFVALAILLFLIYLLCSGIGKLFGKASNKPVAVPVDNTPKEITINMAVTGDIMCHSTNFESAYNSETQTYDFSDVFSDVKAQLINADITVGNLETTFAGSKNKYSGYPNFNTPEQLAKNLADVGFDVLSTANNHSLDKWYAGLESTLSELDKVGILHTGTYRSAEEQNTITCKNVNGINIAFLSFTYGTNGMPIPSDKPYCINLIDKNLILDQIAKAKAVNPDLICVFMHWGEEYKLVPNSTQEELAEFLFTNGADIVLGSHAHVLQRMEKRTIKLDDGTTKDGFLIYSLGNFMSGQIIENTRNSIILNLKITKHLDTGKVTIDEYSHTPTYMYDKGAGQPDRYKILDINKQIADYESGASSISENLYNTLVSTKAKFDKVLAGD